VSGRVMAATPGERATSRAGTGWGRARCPGPGLATWSAPGAQARVGPLVPDVAVRTPVRGFDGNEKVPPRRAGEGDQPSGKTVPPERQGDSARPDATPAEY